MFIRAGADRIGEICRYSPTSEWMHHGSQSSDYAKGSMAQVHITPFLADKMDHVIRTVESWRKVWNF